ncbi:hydroxymethylglutaryl-CoA lyase [soil metagenome]
MQEAKNIQLIECPRDAMQGWPHFISTQQKINYINTLLQVGFDTIDFGSFVSPKAIPQMADTVEVLKGLKVDNLKTKLLAIVANLRGAEDAVLFDTITYLGFPFSISPTFQLRNTNSTIEESLCRVEAIQNICVKNQKELVIYLSMGFGNPYGDVYNKDILLHWANEMAKLDIKIISLADTVGVAEPQDISLALEALIPEYPAVEFGVHLHSSAANVYEKLQAAVNAGCKRFDGALKGLGGCPMAQDDLVGNMPTELMIAYFQEQQLMNELNNEALQHALQMANEIFIK